MIIERDQNLWTQAERDEHTVKGWRTRRAGEYPLVASICRPLDYANDLLRGTVEFDRIWRNYSYHTVSIPSGTVVNGCNFTQIIPNTICIIISNLPDIVTLEDCNLCNVRLQPGWIIRRCMTVQSWLVKTNGVEERVKVAGHQADLQPADLIPPPGAVTSRIF